MFIVAGAILKDFMEDDHDHSFSIAVLSVQIFTVPTLAHYLIAKQDVFAVLMRTFMSEAERKRGARGGKLEFQRNLSTQSHFRRTYCILHDLKHLLTTPPDEWDNDLKKGFLYGVSLLFDILMWMQGMDEQVSVTNVNQVFVPTGHRLTLFLHRLSARRSAR